MNYFERSYKIAISNYQQYRDANEFQRSNLAFGAAGNLSRGSSNTLRRINNVSHDRSIHAGIRKIMFAIYSGNLFTRREVDGINYVENVQFDKINEILEDMNLHSSYTDETGYSQLMFNSYPLGHKLEAMIYFINRYGSKTDKRILIPMLTFE